MATQFKLETYRAAFERLCKDYAIHASSSSTLERNALGNYADPAIQAAWWGYQEGLKAAIEQNEPALPTTWPEDLSLYGEYLGSNIGQATH